MLDKHLIANTDAAANEENLIVLGNFRVTVLSDRLLRVEKDKERIFEDGATQSIWFRNFPKQDFSASERCGVLKIITSSTEFSINTVEYEKSYAKINGKKVVFDNAQNLLGTARTLDGYDGDLGRWKPSNVGEKIAIGYGVCSKNGVAVINDSNSLILADDGKLTNRRTEEIDEYIFAFGHDYRGAVKALYDICGKTPLIPRWALGNWWSRYHKYTDKEYLHLLDDFEKDGVPLSVATIDMDWHYSDTLKEDKNIPDEYANDPDYMGLSALTSHGGIGWTGYSWNKNLFPDYKDFLQNVHNRGIKVTLNLHPAGGVRYFEDMYEEFCNAMGKDPSDKKQVPFDITDDDFINNYFKILHKPYEADGVNFWWIDWQQGNTTKMEGLDPLWALNHYHFLDNAENHKDPLLMSRYCGVGAHRYPLGFSGDTFTTWKSLKYLPEFTNRSANIGYTWWSHDIGGHLDGDKDDEMMIRYVQYGVFNPIMRLHSTAQPIMSKEPNVYVNGSNFIIMEQMKLRHRLVPYIYTANYMNSEYGRPLCEPIYYTEPESAGAYRYDNNYMFGSELFVAPIVTKGVNRVAKVKAYLPNGRWTDIFNGNTYVGGKEVTLYRFEDSIPVLAREGAVIPMAKTVEGNNPENPKALEVLLFKGNNSYTMYEDKGNSKLFTKFELTNNGNCQKVKITAKGDYSVMPENRSVKLVFKDIKTGTVKLLVNGRETEICYDDNHCITAEIGNFVPNETYEFTVEYNEPAEMDEIMSIARYYLLRTEDDTFAKKSLFKRLSLLNSPEEVFNLIESSKCNRNTKNLLKEALLYRG